MHSNVQMTASVESGGKSLLQHSQLGLNSSIKFSQLIDNAAQHAQPRNGGEAVKPWLRLIFIGRRDNKASLTK